MKLAALLRLSFVLLVLGVADFAGAKTDTGAGGPAPVLYKREAHFSRLYNPAIKPERPAIPVVFGPLVYPPKWKQWGQPAYAVMAYLVDETGRTIEIQCIEATDRAFAKAAESWVERTRFIPALKSQQGVCSKVEQRIEFTLDTPTAGAAVPAAPATSAAPAAPAKP